ncbi:MAG: DUF4838 domain-containing protein [Ginsengibacter sp.]
MKRRKFIKLSSLSTIALSVFSRGNTLPFISNGSFGIFNRSEGMADSISLSEMKDWNIIVGTEAIPSEKYAADEFQRLFKAITTHELKIKSGSDGYHGICIGADVAIQSHTPDFTLSSLGEEGLHIRASKNELVIAGGRPRGTLYGVYEFFERYIGIRFLTHDHTYIPQNASSVLIPSGDYSYAPHFSFRWSFYKENFDQPSFATCLRVNTITNEERLGGKTSQELISHSISNYVPVSIYGKDHPEYFALVNGIRKLNVGGGGPQVCSTNPDVIRSVTKGVQKVLDDDPSLKSISVSQMDNDSVCECPVCSAVSTREGSMGAPHLTLVNAVAKSIAISHPGVKIGTLAYWYSRKPPKNLKLLDNVEIMLCSIECCNLHPLNDPDCSRNKLFCEDYYKWKKICNTILIWNYDTNFSAYDLPFPNFNVVAKNIQLFEENGAEGVFMEAAGNGLSAEMSDLRNYVMSRCLWYPTMESWELVEEFCHLHYGFAAPPIMAYLHFLHDNAEKRGVHPNCFPKAVEVGLDLAVSRQIYSYFQEALSLAGDEVTRLRVEKATIPALRALFETVPRICNNGYYQFDTSVVGEEIFDRYKILTKKFSMERVSEVKMTATYLNELDTLKKGLPVIILENEIWKVLILPEQKGRIAGIFHKPTKSRLINEPGAENAGITSSKVTENTWVHEKNSVIVTIKYEDGSIWVRTISLPFQKEEIRINAVYTAGQEKSEWEIIESPCLFRISGSEDPKVISVFTKDLKWNWENPDWQFDREINFRHPLKAGTNCTSYAFYDHSRHLGIKQTFEKGAFNRFFLFWHPGREEVRMEMCLPVRTIQKGQRLSFSYGINFLEKQPGML